MKNLTKLFIIILSLLAFQSCENDDETTRKLLKTFNVELSAQYSVPANTSRSETGTAVLKLYDDNALEFTITVNGLSSTDALTAAHVHLGDLVSTGGVAITLVDGSTVSFNGNSASGTVKLSSDELMYLNSSNIYVNVHSTEVAAGLVRGSVDKTIAFSMDVALSTANTVPLVIGRTETGTAYLRLDSDMNLYYKIVVNGLDASDKIVSGHIHNGAVGVSGSVFATLVSSDADINVSKMLTFSSADNTSFLNDALYINIHSTQEASGLIRGQIR